MSLEDDLARAKTDYVRVKAELAAKWDKGKEPSIKDQKSEYLLKSEIENIEFMMTFRGLSPSIDNYFVEMRNVYNTYMNLLDLEGDKNEEKNANKTCHFIE